MIAISVQDTDYHRECREEVRRWELIHHYELRRGVDEEHGYAQVQCGEPLFLGLGLVAPLKKVYKEDTNEYPEKFLGYEVDDVFHTL